MFETAELGRSLSKADYEERVPELRKALLDAQFGIENAAFPVVILVNGVDGAGKGDTVNLLHEWMDARYLTTHAFGAPTDEELQRPEFWRYWMSLPPKGRIGILFSSWYTNPILKRVYDEADDDALQSALARINDFERALVDDGALLIKFWFHLAKKQQKKHFKKLEKSSTTRWRVTKTDWKHHALYDDFVRVCGHVIRRTSTGEAPWTVVEGTDHRHRNVTVAEHIVDRIRSHQAARPARSKLQPPSIESEDPLTILDTLDLSKSLDKSEYEERLADAQARLNKLSRKLPKKELGVTLVFEGWDAAGKGGAIRRITRALDARQYRVISVAAPTDEERAHHYLWRFWRHLPRMGRLTIYDRSWYGRVLVERVEGFASEPEWMRAYKEINDFEKQLTDRGIVVVKYWLHISSEEQLKRFRDRETKPHKQHKITDEDYRNREKWHNYESAANDMVGRTSTEYAPWWLIAAEDKRHARVQVLTTLCEQLEKAL